MVKPTDRWALIGAAMLSVSTLESVDAQEATAPIFGLAPHSAAPPEQARRIAEINPASINRAPSGSVVSLTGDEIERIDLTGVLIFPGSEDESFEVNEGLLLVQLEAALERLRPLTLRNRTVDLAIQSAGTGPVRSPGSLLVRVAELIDGVPAEPAGLIGIDPASGRIQTFSLLLLADGVQPADRSLWLSKGQAVALAQKIIVSEHGGSFPRVPEATLRLILRSELEASPEWKIQFSEGPPYGVLIDAIGGAARTYPTAIN